MTSNAIVAIGLLVTLSLILEMGLPLVLAALRKVREKHGKAVGPIDGAIGQTASTTPEAAPRANMECMRETARARDSSKRNSDEAQRLWAEAQTLVPSSIPNWDTDHWYLVRAYGAARLGHLEAMVKVGEYAYQRGAIVEAYYWTALAELRGATGLESVLRKMRAQWVVEGCPDEQENIHGEFSEAQASFALALLGIRCAVDAPTARAAIREMASNGVEEAQLFLSRNASAR